MTDRSASRPGSQDGSALLVAMTALALLSSITALALLQARCDFLIHHRSHAALAAQATAEAGLALALADLRRDARYSRLSEAAEGPYPFAVAPPEFFPEQPSRFTVTVHARDADSVDILATATGIGAATARVVATARRGDTPLVPGALCSQASPPSLLIGADFRVTASDGALGIGLPSSDAGRALEAALDSSTLAQIEGDPPIGASDLGWGAPLFDRVAHAATPLPAEVAGALGRGLFLAANSLRIADASAAGILVVDGDLHVDGAFQFDGIAVVRGDVVFAADSDVRITGSLVQLAPGGLLHLRGRGALRFDAATVLTVDDEHAGMLERRAIVTGWRDDT